MAGWRKEMVDKFGTPPDSFVEHHVAQCRRKGRGNGGRKRCAESLWLKCKEAGIEPVLSHNDLPDDVKEKHKES